MCISVISDASFNSSSSLLSSSLTYSVGTNGLESSSSSLLPLHFERRTSLLPSDAEAESLRYWGSPFAREV
ncbi:unnamed protein product [Chondrus crispus]|uniref:Uncharacterized protein n=1 Tax=Chondrus crispus TaxID=2769 RepID=R7QAG5_CHOCR|nr:unnamed protein product [Chondrus crispus]CDF34793.1 unnamed protein product [Chondrus crispus]|eukprot:XP_005714612.1 unnamed protein product [Chondrus crispus]